MQGRGPIFMLPRLNSEKHQTVEVSKSRAVWRSPRCWLGTGQAGRCVLFVSRLVPALPACTSLPGCPQWTVRRQRWTCQRAPRSPSYEGSGAQWQGRAAVTTRKAFHKPSLTANQHEDHSMGGRGVFCWALVYREDVNKAGR